MAGLNGQAPVNGGTFPGAVIMDQQIASPSQGNLTKGKEPVADVYRGICEVAKAISRDGIVKGRRNEQQGYGFRGIDDVYNALSGLLAAAEICILPRMISRTQEERTTPKGSVLFYVTVQADFDIVSSRDGSSHTVTMYGEAMDSADKATNKAMSAAYKYCCMQVFCIPTEGMADADATTPAPAPKGTQAAANAVAAQKIAAGPIPPEKRDPQPAPWTNRTEMMRAFGRVRERVSEAIYRETLTRYHATPELNWKSAQEALNAYSELIEKAVVAAAPAPSTATGDGGFVPPKPPATSTTVAPTPEKPWNNRGEMREAFARLREIVGEIAYLGEMAIAGVRNPSEFRNTPDAEASYFRLLAIADKEAA